jgi:hypothetical protein
MATWWRRYYYFRCGDQDNSRLKNGFDNFVYRRNSDILSGYTKNQG